MNSIKKDEKLIQFKTVMTAYYTVKKKTYKQNSQFKVEQIN